MNDYTPLTLLYREAVQNFPFPDLKRSGGVEGNFSNETENALYSESFSFIAGRIESKPIHANGCIEYSGEGGEVKIVALFWLSVKTRWFTQTELGTILMGEYQIQKKKWRLELTSINK
jgi:hypothetical protein